MLRWLTLAVKPGELWRCGRPPRGAKPAKLRLITGEYSTQIRSSCQQIQTQAEKSLQMFPGNKNISK